MGQARKVLQHLLATDPVCIYCGTSAAASRDHCPPLSVFLNRHRPKGLEFAACNECHNGTRQMDLVAGMISRLLPTPETDEGRTEVREHIRGVINNHRELALLFHDEQRRGQEVSYAGRPAIAIRVRDHEQLNRCMNGFAARVGFALYRRVMGSRMPEGATIMARWMSNVELDSNETLDGFLRSIGNPGTLSAGRWHVTDQFRYWAAPASDDTESFACFAGFRRSFGVFAATLRSIPEMPPDTIQFRPGFLKGFSF